MEVILKEDVAKLGSRGDVVKVAEGYGRNYLLPRKLAIRASEGNKAVVGQMKAAAVRRSAKEKSGAEVLAKQFEGVSVSFQRRSGNTISCSGRSPLATLRMRSPRRDSTWIGVRSRFMSRLRRWASSMCRSACTRMSPRI